MCPPSRRKMPRWSLVCLVVLIAIGCVTAAAKRRFFSPCGADSECSSALCYVGICTSTCGDTKPCSQGVCLDARCAPPCSASVACPTGWTCTPQGCSAKGNLADTSTTDAQPDTAETTPLPDVDAGELASDAPEADVTAAPPVYGKLAAGEVFSCALGSDAKTQCWGVNYNGQLATGDGITQHSPTLAKLVPSATAIAAYLDHGCALIAGSKVVCWGGSGTGAANGQPAIDAVVAVNIAKPIQRLALGKAFSCALDTDGGVWCWGDNQYGQLGDGTKTSRPGAQLVAGLGKVSAFAAGGEHVCAVTSDQKMACWGLFAAAWDSLAAAQPYTKPTSLPGLANVDQVVAGGLNTCAIAADGAVTCWGDNTAGFLGVGDDVYHDGPTAATALGKVKQMALSSGGYGCAIGTDNALRCLGAGAQGQLGNSQAGPSIQPVAVTDVSGAVEVALGTNHACAATAAGGVWCWGANDQGQVGNGTTDNEPLPTQMVGVADASQVAVGHGHLCVIRAGGTVSCSGYNGHGSLGTGDLATQLTTVTVKGLSGATQLSAGQNQTCAILTGDQLRCWGGDLLIQALTPKALPGLPTAQSTACGAGTTCVLANGAVSCFGGDDHGSLGNGPTNGPNDKVVSVLGLSDATALAGPHFTFCAIRKTGGVVCWGRNDMGQAGIANGNQTVHEPAAVTLPGAPATAVQLAMAYDGGCARLSTGAVACWGEKSQQYSGAATALPATLVADMGSVTDLAMSDAMLCGLNAGKVGCMGNEVPGGWQAGQKATVVTLPALAVAIGAGPHDVCAVLQNGQVWCWGYNEYGQLGNGKGPVVVPVAAVP